jgi:hypothetical protein
MPFFIRRSCSLLLLPLLFSACSRGSDARVDTTTPAAATTQAATAPNPDAPVMLRGTIASVSPTELVMKTDTATVTVKLEQPFHLYTREPSDLSHVTQSSFIGVTTVKQPDGTEQATEIHVFPEDLRGLGEGSRMMTPDTGSAASRMTNGTASPAPTASRMSNGSVSSTNGSTLVVQYAGGSQNVTVPPNTPVTDFTLSTKPLAAGDQVAIIVKKAADGTLTSSKGVSTKK